MTQKLAGRETCDALEETGEMVWIIETEKTGSLANVVAPHQQTFCLVDDIVMNIAYGISARLFADQVSKIAGRISQLRSTIGNGGQAVRQLPVLSEIGL